jgi:hypothetical protein
MQRLADGDERIVDKKAYADGLKHFIPKCPIEELRQDFGG